LRGLPYQLTGTGSLAAPERDRGALADKLRTAGEETYDSPIFQLWRELPEPDISPLDAETFHHRMERSNKLRGQLAAAQHKGVEAIREVRSQLGRLRDEEPGVLLELMQAFRDAEQFDDMIDVVERMPRGLAGTVSVREQYALALNRAGQSEQAEQVLLKLIDDRGPSSETYGILGRVYKDRWEAARRGGDPVLAGGLLKAAIDAYVKGFQTDWRDPYPGINAVQLMELQDRPDRRRHELLPVVTYSVKRRLASTRPDFWDYATLLELAVLDGDEELAMDALEHAVAAVRAPFQPNSTLGTLRRLRQTREARQPREPAPAWALEIERALQASAARIGHSAS
jgi:tetratricopeptide (TPR) repeat protein